MIFISVDFVELIDSSQSLNIPSQEIIQKQDHQNRNDLVKIYNVIFPINIYNEKLAITVDYCRISNYCNR